MMLKGMSKESSGEVGKRIEGRRVARVQPQKGQNVNDQGFSYTHEIGNVKSVKPRGRRSPSVQRPILPKWDISQQELLKISDSRATIGQGANSADSQPLLILTGLAMPMIGSQQATHLVPFHADGIVPSCQKITQDASKQSGCPISTGPKATDHGLDDVRNSNGMGISNTNQEYVNFIVSNQIDHTLTNYNQIANIQTNIDRSRVSYNGALQLPPSFDQRIPEFSDFPTDTAEGQMKSLSYNREMLASSLMHHDTWTDMMGGAGCNTRFANEEHHRTGKTDTESRITMMNDKGNNTTEESNGNKMQYVRNPSDKLRNAQISLGSVHDNHGCSQYFNQNEQMSSNFNGCLHPVRNTGPKWDDTIPRGRHISINPQVKDPTLKPACTKIDPSTFPQHCIGEQNKNNPCVKPPLQKAPRQIPRYKQDKDRIFKDLKREHLTYFNSLDRNGKTALLRCKYANLLKRRNKQLQRFDPKYRLSLKRMSNASQEVHTLSKLTKFNRPPRLSRMANSSQSMLSGNPHVALGTAGPLDVADDHSVIDLTEDSPCIRHEDKNPPAELSSRRHKSRLPSYEEAMTLRAKDTNDRTSVDPLPALARRLLLSSQEFFKNLQGHGKLSRERLHTHSGRLMDSSTPTSLMSSRKPHAVNPGSIEPLAVPQDATINNIYPSSQDCSLTSDKSELLTPSVSSAVALPQSISGHGMCKPTNGTALSSQTHDLQKDCESEKCSDNTSRNQCIKMECDVETRPETGMKSGLSTDEPDTLFQPTDTSSWMDKRKDNSVTMTTRMDSLDEKLGIVYQGSERHTLKNAVVRIEDFRKRLTRLQKKTEDILDDKNASHLEQRKRQKRNHRSSNYGWQTRNAGTKQRGTSTADCSSRSRHNFQDFVPTILPTRTRTATSRLGHSSRVLAMELLQNDLDDVINDGMKVEDDINKDDEDYTPRNKHARRHRIRRKRSSPLSFSTTTAVSLPSSSSSSSSPPPPSLSSLSQPSSSERCGVEVDTVTETETASVSFGSGSKYERGSSVRVEIGTNSENHIKLKFVNLRSIYSGSSSGNQSQHRTHRKAKLKQKGDEKIDDSSKAAKEGNKTFMFDVGPKAKKRSSNNLETDTSTHSTSLEMDSVPVDPPLGIKKLIINKKRGETLLHRAAKLGNMEILRYCIDNGLEDVNVHDHAGYTSLHDSCVPGHLNVARFLINHGADVNAEAYDGTRPINDAVENNHVELVRLLLAHGADPFYPKPNGRTCIELALDQSSEMKSLIFGYLEDMKVERRDLEDGL
ncbi:uncharacterized protein LOC121429954 [Lytechinus variegatus]|uniref:uncharacterized protein LOC121429954 n=1 Tax=Lytechinus variegatus TaxID=7654 RepID=UPI001BB20A0A|nr:uncharacterized protein LOC121429954 [Lytechinus variegatus]